jgi:lipopolysaccharide export system permease protein
MMPRLANNVGASVLTMIGAVLMVLLGVELISGLIDETDDITNNYKFVNVLVYVAMTMPASIYEFIPFACLSGCLIGLGALASNSELIIMRAAGVSLMRIVWFVMRPVLLVILVGTLIAEYLVPFADQHAQSYKALLQGSSGVKSSSSDLWNKEGDEFMHFNVVAPGGVLYGVTRFTFNDDKEIQQASFAKRATFYGDYWQEEDVQISRFFPDRVETDSELLRRWDTNLSPDLLNLISVQESSLSIGGLYNYANYLESQGQDSAKYWLEFWNKTFQPLSILSLVIIAISFIFGPLRSVTMGFRIFSGVLVGIVFNISQKMLGPASLVFGFSPVIAVLIPVVFCIALGLILLRRSG